MDKDKQYAKIICEECGPKFLTEKQYEAGLNEPHKGWRCPQCNCYPCDFDDLYFEQKHEL